VCTESICFVPKIGNSVRDSVAKKMTNHAGKMDHAQLIYYFLKVLDTTCAPKRIFVVTDLFQLGDKKSL